MYSTPAKYVQGVLRALEEYGVPIDHIAGERGLLLCIPRLVTTLSRHEHRRLCRGFVRTRG